VATMRPSHVSWLESEVERLTSQLRPAPSPVIDEAVRLVLNPFGGRAGGEEPKVKAYLIALDGFPARAIEAAVRDVLQGRAEGVDPRFPPTPPQLARLCRAHRDRMADELGRRRGEFQRALPPPREDREPTPGERARVSAGLRDLADALGRGAAERSLAEAAAKVARDAAHAGAGGARAERAGSSDGGNGEPA